MRILVVQESDWLARGPHQQHHLMEKLSLRGHQIRVIDYEVAWRERRNISLLSRRQVFDGVTKIHRDARVSVIRPTLLRIPHLDYVAILFSHAMEIIRQIKEFKPDIIVGFGILNSYIAMRLVRGRIPFAYYLIDALHTLVPFQAYQPIAKAIESRTLQAADGVVVINDELRNYAIEMGATPHKTTVIRAGIDLERFNPKINGQEIRKSYGIRRDDIVLLFMGWLYNFSGLREVALELSKAIDEYGKLKLLVVGEGDLFGELQRIKETRNLNQLILAGRQPYARIPAFICASDICLLPAHKNVIMENIVPIKMYEYMACAKPVISTYLKGVVREFGHDSGVFYVREPKEVLKRALELSSDSQLLNASRLKARSAAERFDWDHIASDFEKTLREMVN